MARTYLVFGDIEGKLDMLRVRVYEVRTQGPLQCPQANREIRAQGKHDEMEAAAQWRLSKAGRPAIARAVRSALPRSAEGALVSRFLQHEPLALVFAELERLDGHGLGSLRVKCLRVFPQTKGPGIARRGQLREDTMKLRWAIPIAQHSRILPPA
jgi:hypothetical protein